MDLSKYRNALVDPSTLQNNKMLVSATVASFTSTLAGYPLDSMKSRLQASRKSITVPTLALTVYREEGIGGFFRGIWIPLCTISAVRAASFAIYGGTKQFLANREIMSNYRLLDVGGSGGLGGALAGAIISFGSAPFELIKVRRQLEYSIAQERGLTVAKAPTSIQAIRDIVQGSGLSGLYMGFRLHFFRDMMGTALYFMEYDSFRYLLGRQQSGEQGPVPAWMPIHPNLIPFLCGSLAGVTSWALIYPVDVIKTKVQQRSLAGKPPRTIYEQFQRLIRGPDPENPKTLVQGVTRIYRGLGVSALRSITTHGLLWTIFDYVSTRIDRLQPEDED